MASEKRIRAEIGAIESLNDRLTDCKPASTIRLHFGQVAQLVEQRTENPCVGGSIPSLATNLSNHLQRVI
jgi:hypothetical protein